MHFCLTCDMWHLLPGSYLSEVLATSAWLCPQTHKDRGLEKQNINPVGMSMARFSGLLYHLSVGIGAWLSPIPGI